MNNNTLDGKVQEFLRLYKTSSDSLTAAGKLLVQMIDEDENACAHIKEASGGRISDATLAVFVRIGHGQLLPQLVTSSCPAYRKLRTLPLTVQQTCLERGTVPMLLTAADRDFVNVPLTDLNDAQVKQCFDRVGVRSHEEQQAWLRRSVSQAGQANEDEAPRYQVTKGKVRILRGGYDLTVRQLAAIMAEAT